MLLCPAAAAAAVRAVKPHSFVSATAVGNRVFILNVSAKSSRAWQKNRDLMRVIQASFLVPDPNLA
jgi:hypothetical protein